MLLADLSLYWASGPQQGSGAYSSAKCLNLSSTKTEFLTFPKDNSTKIRYAFCVEAHFSKQEGRVC